MVAPMAAQQPKADPIQLFNLLTRSYTASINPTGSSTRASGGGNIALWNIPTAGLLARIYISITGTFNALTGTPNKYGQSSLLRGIRLQSSTTNDLFNVRGPSYFGILAPFLDQVGNAIPQSTGWTAIANSAAINLPVIIPCTVNLRDVTGLLAAQNRDTLLTLQVEYETDAIVAPSGITFTTQPTATAFADSFTVPPNPAALPPMNVLHQIIDQTETVSASGVYAHQWDRNNLYLQKFHGMGFQVTSPSDTWTYADLDVQVTQHMYHLTPALADIRVPYFRPGNARRAGIIPFDLVAQSGLGIYDTPRDAIPSWEYSSLVTNINATGADTLYTVSRQLAPLS